MTLLGRCIRSLGVKKAAKALGYSVGYTYALARDPADPQHAENIGAETDCWQRCEALFEVMSTYPALRPELMRARSDIDRFFARLLDRREEPRVTTHAEVIPNAARCAKEHGDAMSEALTDGDHARAVHECAESIDATMGLMRALQDLLDHEATIPMHGRRAG